MLESKEKRKTREYYADWYEKNKERLSAKRAARYRNDPSYRKTILQSARERRDSKPRKSLRRVGDKFVVVLSSTSVALMANRSRRTIQSWEELGLIPQPTISGDHRLYTRGQAALVRKIGRALDSGATKEEVEKVAMGIAEKWSEA